MVLNEIDGIKGNYPDSVSRNNLIIKKKLHIVVMYSFFERLVALFSTERFISIRFKKIISFFN